ncbi:MAG: antitoxin MazE [Limisphaerales bacterium]|jgi:antitoxin MazE
MKTTLQKWGNSQGVRIPKSIIDTLGINVGCKVKLEVDEDKSKITLSPTVDTRPVRGRHRIENLLASSSPDAFDGEVDWGKPQGQEVW